MNRNNSDPKTITAAKNEHQWSPAGSRPFLQGNQSYALTRGEPVTHPVIIHQHIW